MNTAQRIELIETTLTRRGSGIDERSPIRAITEYWTPEGKKVAEIDPCAVSVTPEVRQKLCDNLKARIDGDGWQRAYDAVLEVLNKLF